MSVHIIHCPNIVSSHLSDMLSRALTVKPKRSPKYEYGYSKSVSISDMYEDCIVGFMEDLPLVHCGYGKTTETQQLTLREVLRASMGVIGDSRLGMTEKVVLLDGRICALKRFRKVIVGRSEFGRRIERLAQICDKCKYLVPISACLYSKRVKFILSEYYPMGSLADLLAGSRQHGHTAMDWNQRLNIVFDVARAFSFIHSQFPAQEKNMQMNVHGNLKASNVMINTDFSASLSDYGISHLGERVEVSNTSQMPMIYDEDDLCQKCDIYNFGVIVLDVLASHKALTLLMISTKCKTDYNKEKVKIVEGEVDFFEFTVGHVEKKQALQVLDIALACTNIKPKARPSIEKIKFLLQDIIVANGKVLSC